ncbi:cystathionine gamma-lyase [Fodinicola acaciae]|uniref:cystathionine gamma-lyase n=1 Tax=Fodinicola acaciae TaxID=2681555 RepID=UPI0013CFC6E2|nr:cystathionine gamma-lyase [Fodinicola acaciae]
MNEWGDGTRVVTGGMAPAQAGQPLLPSPVFAAPFHLGDQPAGTADGYGRISHPSIRHFETALAGLEGGPVVAFATGMAAVSAVLLESLRPGDAVVLPSDGYYTTRQLAADYLAPRGVEVREVPTAADHSAAVDGARLVLLETPSNPGLDVCDIAEISTAAHRAGALVAVDNTTATPLGQRALELGADLVISSDTKALTGHSDLILGHVGCRDQRLADRLAAWRRAAGAMPGPFEVWLAHRSLGTLDLRLRRQADNALALVEVLAKTDGVSGLRYPGWPADPAYALASRQMRRFGGVVSFTLPSAETVARFVAESALVSAATSFGGLHSTVDRRAQWGGDDVPDGFVRFSAGCEDTADLVADVSAALDHAL